MPYTAQQIYDEVCDMLLEDGGLQFVYTEAAFLRDLATSLSEFMQSTGIVKKLLTEQVKAGVSEYTLPVVGMDVQQAFYDNTFLYDSSGYFIDASHPSWQVEPGTPYQWRQDQLAANAIEVAPPPDMTGRSALFDFPMFGLVSATHDAYDMDILHTEPWFGTIGVGESDYYLETTAPMLGIIGSIVVSDSNLTMLTTAQPSNRDLALDSYLELIPDMLAPYLAWFVLYKVWAGDGEGKDPQRARYANARRVEAINLCKIVSGEDLMEKA
jgi:hypothetical protein